MLLAWLIKVSLLLVSVMATSLPVSQSKAKEFEVENLKHQPGPQFKFPKRSYGKKNNCSTIISTFLVLKVAISSL